MNCKQHGPLMEWAVINGKCARCFFGMPIHEDMRIKPGRIVLLTPADKDEIAENYKDTILGCKAYFLDGLEP